MKSLIVIGCGAHGRIVAEAAAASHRVLGFADDNAARHATRVDDWPVLGAWVELEADEFIVAIGDNAARARLFSAVRASGRMMAKVVAPGAWVSKRAELGAGTVVLAGAVVQAGARVGVNVLLNAGCVVDHDAVIGDHAHVAPGAVVASFGVVAPSEWLRAGEVRMRN